MLIVVGTNHKHAPLEIREKLAFSKSGLDEALRALAVVRGIEAAVVLSTCNRVELYADADDPVAATQTLTAFLAWRGGLTHERLAPYLYAYAGHEAARHLFGVACGIDSQITGEPQILEQVRGAYEKARAASCTNEFLGLIFSKAASAGAAARQKTCISSGDVSLGSVCVELMEAEAGGLKNKRILVVGTGKISRLVIQRLAAQHLKAVIVSSRTYKKAKQLAADFGAQVVRFERLKEELLGADVVVSATASPHPIIKKDDVADVMEERWRMRDTRLIFLLDLAVPRDVEESVRGLGGVRLFSLEDLDATIKKNLADRERAVPQVEAIIKEEVGELCQECFA